MFNSIKKYFKQIHKIIKFRTRLNEMLKIRELLLKEENIMLDEKDIESVKTLLKIESKVDNYYNVLNSEYNLLK